MIEKIRAEIANQILDTLTKEKFARWYEDKFVPDYVEGGTISKQEILSQITELFIK